MKFTLLSVVLLSVNALYIRDVAADQAAVQADKQALASDPNFQKLQSDKKAAKAAIKADKAALAGNADFTALEQAEKTLHQTAKQNNVSLKGLKGATSTGNAAVDAALKNVNDLKTKLANDPNFQKLQSDKAAEKTTVQADKAQLANNAAFQKLQTDQKQLRADRKAAKAAASAAPQ
ncbi:hypothetical protein HK103_006710 [Boothiomyces macroporosus]|uniref:Small secreted protein n=1 Tax=Boothiomyces macroporosus TaxID=261099 RepID=A0AAD5Y2E8_9FUNG|nr:hypothetical protein HK103_006710 [Boothiomyces macroporosus]